MVASGEVEGEGGGLLQSGGAQAEEVRPTDAQEVGGGVRVKVAAVESVGRLAEELEGKTFGELMFCTRPLSGGVARPPESQHPSLLLLPPRHAAFRGFRRPEKRPRRAAKEATCPVLALDRARIWLARRPQGWQ